MVKKILIISESIDIDDSSGSKVNVALITNLHKIGYQIKVLHYTRKEIQLSGITCVNIPELKFNLNYLLSRTQRVLQRTLKVNFSRFLESIFGHSFTFFNDSKSIAKAIKKHYTDQDLVLTLSKGASYRPHHAMLSVKELHDKWVNFVHDPYPFHHYPPPYDWVESGHVFKEQFFREVSEKAKHAVFPSLLLKEWMEQFYPNFSNSGVVIPHQTFEENFEKTNFPDYFEQTKFTILHAGNLMKQRSPKGLIEGFMRFLEKNPQAKNNTQLLLLGNADYHKKELVKWSKKIPQLYVSNGNVPFKEVYHLQNNVSVNVILESKSEISPFLPGKFPHCVVANKPILSLAPVKSETQRLLGEAYLFKAAVDDIEKIANLLEMLYLQWEKDPSTLLLDRKDLKKYVSLAYLEEAINALCL